MIRRAPVRLSSNAEPYTDEVRAAPQQGEEEFSPGDRAFASSPSDPQGPDLERAAKEFSKALVFGWLDPREEPERV